MSDLSILIPARNEMFLRKTVENILENIRADTNIIVVMDGQWADPPLRQHERVTVLHFPESIGQRAATNMAARVSTAKYVAKCDAHCSFDEGFDQVLLDDIQEGWTILPKMYNLHAFDWVCQKCDERWYQGPTPEKCRNEDCDSTEFERDILWRHKTNPTTTAMRFDRNLKFQYWSGYKSRQGDADLVETMSILGAFWMCSREMYFRLNMCDEGHGSWGQMGTEVACKTWLSGGRLIVDKKTWFAHMFRTQGGDFGFPYKLKGSDVRKARRYSKDLWINNKWEHAVYDLDWLLDKFKPVPDWHDD